MKLTSHVRAHALFSACFSQQQQNLSIFRSAQAGSLLHLPKRPVSARENEHDIPFASFPLLIQIRALESDRPPPPSEEDIDERIDRPVRLVALHRLRHALAECHERLELLRSKDERHPLVHVRGHRRSDVSAPPAAACRAFPTTALAVALSVVVVVTVVVVVGAVVCPPPPLRRRGRRLQRRDLSGIRNSGSPRRPCCSRS